MTPLPWSSVLVVAPHADDETLIAGGLVHRIAREGGRATCLVLNVEQPHRREEAEAACSVLGADLAVMGSFPDGLDRLALRDVVEHIEPVVEAVRPDVLVLPAEGAHQDHRVAHQAGVICARPMGATSRYRAPWVLVGEEMSDGWPPGLHLPRSLTVELEEQDVRAKVGAMACHESQMRDVPSERSLTQIEAVCRVRGGQAGFHWGEAYAVLRAAL